MGLRRQSNVGIHLTNDLLPSQRWLQSVSAQSKIKVYLRVIILYNLQTTIRLSVFESNKYYAANAAYQIGWSDSFGIIYTLA